MRSLAIGLATLLGAVSNAESSPSVPDCGLYVYRAEIVRVIDGDTVVADIDLGFSTWRRGEHLRLAGIDAPEVRGDDREAGFASARALRERVLGQTLFICTFRDEQGSFGRYLVEIFVGPDHESINDWMVREGLAKPYPR